MTQHTELIERLHASSRWWFDRGVRNSVDADAIAALEAQAREIAELKAQEAELCTLYGLAQAECQKLRKNAERYQWIKERKSIDLRSDCSTWTREDGKRFIASHFLAAGNTQFAAFESLDETIDAAMKGQP